jgi:S1-C subfamily serine protease
MISRVVPGGPADKAGLQGLAQGFLGRISLGDVILAVDGERVNTGDDLLDKLEARELGDTVVLRILRGGSEAEVQVQLSAAQ